MLWQMQWVLENCLNTQITQVIFYSRTFPTENAITLFVNGRKKWSMKNKKELFVYITTYYLQKYIVVIINTNMYAHYP
jgi:hypothetical protein